MTEREKRGKENAKTQIERRIKGLAARGRDRTILRGKGRRLAGRVGEGVISGSSSALITGPSVNCPRTGEEGGKEGAKHD